MIQIKHFSCPNCFGNLENHGEGWLRCPYCEATFFDKDLHAMDTDTPLAPLRAKSPQEIAEIVRNAALSYAQPDAHGVQISFDGKPLEKEDKARKNFNIPASETIYLIYDETMFGSCKEGYALTDKGLRLSYKEYGPVFFPWNEFTTVTLTYDKSWDLHVNDINMTLTGGNGSACTKEVLEKIQTRLCR